MRKGFEVKQKKAKAKIKAKIKAKVKTKVKTKVKKKNQKEKPKITKNRLRSVRKLVPDKHYSFIHSLEDFRTDITGNFSS